jgi:hypothetical protein
MRQSNSDDCIIVVLECFNLEYKELMLGINVFYVGFHNAI